MKKLIFLWAFILPLLSHAQSMDDKIKVLASEIADQIVKSGSRKVAVTTLDFKGCTTEFGKFLAEELTGNLSVSGRPLTVVNQKMLESLLIQNKLTARGLLEARNEAAKLGQVSGIDALVYGTITTLGEDLRISVSIIRLPTLTVFGYAKSSFPLTSGVKGMLVCKEESQPTTAGSSSEDSSRPSQFPRVAADCMVKKTCIVCTTNKSAIPIKASMYVQYIGSFGTLYIHPGNTKCFENVKINQSEDHGDGSLSYIVEGANVKSDSFVIEPCQVYKRGFTK